MRLSTKTILLNVSAVTVSLIIAATVGAVTISVNGHENAEHKMALECETGRSNLLYYFDGVGQAINVLGNNLEKELNDIPDDQFNVKLAEHIENAKGEFATAEKYTNGVLTYYYRMDPSVTTATGETGFWFVNLNGGGFVEHAVTPLDSEDFECKWYFDTKAAKKPIWLEPYATDNLFDEHSNEVFVISYNYPVIRHDEVVAVLGIEISYKTLGQKIKSIKPYDGGIAFIVSNKDASIIYHPTIDILSMKEKDRPQTPKEFKENFLKHEEHIVYVFEGVKKHSVNLDIGVDMSIVIAVPQKVISNTWLRLVTRLIIVLLGVVIIFGGISIIFSLRITKPLAELTRAAEEIDSGNYSVKLTYKKKDEIGVLSNTVNNLIIDLGEYINDLNALAYADSLTSVGNKAAFDAIAADYQARIDAKEKGLNFAIVMFDCDSLKEINDEYGHEKGDIYLRNACNFICRMFSKSVIYRIGGDEFVAILEGDDFNNRFKIRERFYERSKEISQFTANEWEKIKVSVGIADYDPKLDKTVQNVLTHADHYMYLNKRKRKSGANYVNLDIED